MTRKIFIWVANPKPQSLCNAMADAYQDAAEELGAEVSRMNLADMSFEMAEAGHETPGSRLEQDLAIWQENVAWADHLLIIHPYWWGSMPTKAKAVLDRALTSGFGYKYHGRGIGWDKLLAGKTADAIITSDTPPWIDTLIYRQPGRRVLKNQILGFCGIKARKIVQFGSVKMADEKRIRGWLDQTRTMGMKAAA